MYVGTAAYTHPHTHKHFEWLSPQWRSQWQLRAHMHTNSYLEPHSWGHTGRHTDTGACCRSLCRLCRAEDTSSSAPVPEVSPDTTLLGHCTHYHTAAATVPLFTSILLHLWPLVKSANTRGLFFVLKDSNFTVWVAWANICHPGCQMSKYLDDRPFTFQSRFL